MSNLSNRQVVIIGFVLLGIGIFLLTYDYFTGKKDMAYEKVNISLYSQTTGQTIDNTPKNIASAGVETNIETGDGKFLGVLKIDKINLEQGFYDKGNPYNNVDKSVTLLDPSNYPDQKNGNTILVAHSGTSYIGYFKNLYKLSTGDLASINYKGKTYVYKIVNIYYETKDGDVMIYRNRNKTTLTLITCTKNDDTKQTVYIAELQ